ncbi:MAG TPA: hypothetical protein VG326_03900 [Tepidisphaeraceae bacterium]|jgi:hypothetical protein|nr:hypothetical protein [Tepidisphaeraceae bacterium]
MPTELPPDPEKSWASLFDLDDAERLTDRAWPEEELGAVMRHQLSSPVQFDLQALPGPSADRLEALCAAEGLVIKSFNDLLFHPHPPIELLEMTKRFAKATHGHPDAIVPKDVALLLYYSSIMVALTRCGKRITGLSDHDLALGIRWALDRTWIDEPTRRMLNEGLNEITAGSGTQGARNQTPSAASQENVPR